MGLRNSIYGYEANWLTANRRHSACQALVKRFRLIDSRPWRHITATGRVLSITASCLIAAANIHSSCALSWRIFYHGLLNAHVLYVKRNFFGGIIYSDFLPYSIANMARDSLLVRSNRRHNFEKMLQKSSQTTIIFTPDRDKEKT